MDWGRALDTLGKMMIQLHIHSIYTQVKCTGDSSTWEQASDGHTTPYTCIYTPVKCTGDSMAWEQASGDHTTPYTCIYTPLETYKWGDLQVTEFSTWYKV